MPMNPHGQCRVLRGIPKQARRRGRARTIAIAILAACLAGASGGTGPAAQQSSATIKRIIEDARHANPELRVTLDPKTGMPSRIKGIRPLVDPEIALGVSRGATGAPGDADILKAAEAFFRSGELSAAFTAANPRVEVTASRVRNDPDVPGQSIVHVEQRLDGIPVFGSSGRVIVSPSLAVTQLTTTLSRVEIESTTPTIGKDAAAKVARDHVRALLARKRQDAALDRLRASLDTVAVEPVLAIYDPALLNSRAAKTGPARLSWLATIDVFRVFVDARTGEVLFYYLDQRSMLPRRVNDLEGRFFFPGVVLIDDAAGLRREPIPDDAQNAYVNSGHALDYFTRSFGRSGIDDAGPIDLLPAYVRYGNTTYAIWCRQKTFDCPEPGAIVFGKGTPAALDIVGHEMTHGVVASEADLIYADEPGAVNEALADLFGTLIEYHGDPGAANWILGERYPGLGATSPVRSMADPNLMAADGKTLFQRGKPYGPDNRGQPDHYSDYVNREDPICETTSDYFTGCVHFNSGIMNKLFFLAAEGGRHRGNVNKGIGREKIGRITYRALVAYINPSSGLSETAELMRAACSDLADNKAAGIVADDCDRIRDAQTAVGLLAPSN